MRNRWMWLSVLVLGLTVSMTPQAQELTPLEQLGKDIFFDADLSTPPGQSCATCHDPETAFAGPDSDINAHGAVYPGAVFVRFGNRKPPTAAYAAFSPDFYYDEDEGLYIGGMFWDGRALNVVEQAKGPFLNPVEMNNPGPRQVIIKIRHSDYAGLFEEIFGPGALEDVHTAYDQTAIAIAAYEASSEVNPFSSKYDAYLAGEVELTAQELSGLALFEGQGNCAACHPSQEGPMGEPPLFTDFTYDNLGVPKNLENPFYDMPPKFNPDGENFVDLGLGGILGLSEEMGKMKVPTLRNVGMRPYEGFVQSYTHNGVFKSLHEVVDFYNTRDLGGWPDPEYPENVNDEELGDLGLSEQDVDDIVAFLNTLTDGFVDDERFQGSPDGGRPLAAQVRLSLASPAHTLGQIRLDLAQRTSLALTVLDPSGRAVRTLLAGETLPAGTRTVLWDGSDDRGRLLPSGAYFIRLDAGSQSQMQRMVWLR